MNTFCHFIRPYVCKTLLLFGLLSFAGAAQAQEFLTGLQTNPQIIKAAQQQKELFKSKSKSEEAPLLLPFFEDFSNYTGYPNPKLFMDKQAFVNHTFPLFPPTIGVVTLDALNEFGVIYPHLTTTPRGADTLTSRYIRLDSLFLEDMTRQITPADSLYFSFYFQPGGGRIVGADVGESVGNQPQRGDSLVLEFGYTVGDTAVFWNHVWASPGFNLDEWTAKDSFEYFRQVLIPITKSEYFCDNFQFRFRNYASLEPQQGISGWEGNVDQWHIDYIRLDVNRNHKDVFTNDLAFVSPTTSFLKNYQAMPWKQFQSADMKSNFANQLTNLSDRIRSSTYQYIITHKGDVVYEHPIPAPIDIRPYFTYGIQTEKYQASPEIPFTPTLTDTATFTITHIFQNTTGEDFAPANDTCVFEQKFYDYYAYDDGTAEYGYCINNQFDVGYLAMKFTLRVPDELRAVRMWFNQTKDSANTKARFIVTVWKDYNGQPGDTLYTSQVLQPRFDSVQFLDFVEYPFLRSVSVSGTFWVGFQQEGNVQLNIGFDQNTDSREFFRFNTRGQWEKSVFKGTPMLRPVFGKIAPPVCCAPSKTVMINPNPASDWIKVTSSELQVTGVEIFDVMGRRQKAEGRKEHEEWRMEISHLTPGIYFVKIQKENNTFETLKLIKN